MAFATPLKSGIAATDVQGDVTPTGTVDGSNMTFTIPDAYQSGTLEVFADGIRLIVTTDYTASGTGNKTITTTIPPSQWIRCSYVKS